MSVVEVAVLVQDGQPGVDLGGGGRARAHEVLSASLREDVGVRVRGRVTCRVSGSVTRFGLSGQFRVEVTGCPCCARSWAIRTVSVSLESGIC
ncbi:hypothetical protein GCM10010518_23500 [Kitasatospora cinereorecta]